MATQPHTATVTLGDFLATAAATQDRIEFVDGRIVAMAGTSLEHGLIVQNLSRTLGNALDGGPCRVLSQGVMVRASHRDNAFLPDVFVYCGAAERERGPGVDLILNPVLVVEVLSPSTEDYDHGKKWENYRRIPTLQDYLLISQDRRRVERYSRRGEGFWLFSETTGSDDELRIEELGITLRLSEIYAGIVFPDPESSADAGPVEGRNEGRSRPEAFGS